MTRLTRNGFVGVVQQLLLAAPVRLWALILAGFPLTALDAWLIWILWRGGWPAIEAVTRQRLDIVGAIAGAHVVLLGIVIVSLASVKIEAETKIGKLSIGGDDDAPGAGS